MIIQIESHQHLFASPEAMQEFIQLMRSSEGAQLYTSSGPTEEQLLGYTRPANHQRLMAWARAGRDVGRSSEFMAYMLMDSRARLATLDMHAIADPPYPKTPEDFGHCLALLDAVPEMRERLGNMAFCRSREWTAYIPGKNWNGCTRRATTTDYTIVCSRC